MKTKKLVALAALTVLCVLWLAPVWAQEGEAPAEPPAPPRPKTNFSGVLIDPSTGLKVVGIRLSLVEPGEYATVTGPDGRFTFRDIPVGVYGYMFAYKRGDTEPEQTMLVAMRVPIEAGEKEPVSIPYAQITGPPSQMTARPSVFADGRDREHNQPIMMTDVLGLEWAEEYLSFSVTFPPYTCRESSLRIVDSATGREVPFQMTNPTYGKENNLNACTVTFPARLAPHQKKLYAVCSDWREGFIAQRYATDLKVETREGTGEQILSNAAVALLLPPAKSTKPMPAAECPAPVLALRGPDGVWFGKGSLLSDRTVQSFTCEETEKGPLFKEFKVTYTFAPAKDKDGNDEARPPEYEVTIRLYARRYHVFISETMKGDLDLSFRLSLRENFKPGPTLMAQNGRPAFGTIPEKPKNGLTTLAVFRAWNPAGLRRSHNWYGITSEGDRKDAVGILQINGAAWQFPDRMSWADGSWLSKVDDRDEVRLIATDKPDLYVEFPHRPGTRRVALVVFDKNRNWTPETLRDPKKPEPARMHFLNRLHVQLSQIGLQGLMAAKCERAGASRKNRLLFNAKTFPALKERFKKAPRTFPPELVDVFTGRRWYTTNVRRQVLTATEMLRRALVGTWDERELGGLSGPAGDPRSLEPVIKSALLLYDAHVGSGLFAERERERILGTFALAAARLESLNSLPAYTHDDEAAAARDSTIALISLLLDGHPRSSSRLLGARGRLLGSLAWIRATGGVPFDPNPTLRGMNIWVEVAPVIENATSVHQISSSPFDLPQFVSVLDTFARLTTPPDKRYSGTRLMPTVGLSGVMDAQLLAMTGVAARKLAADLPDVAARLAWIWRQAGRPVFRRRTGHGRLLAILDTAEDEVEPKPPEDVKSTLLPGFGALLRSGFRERDEAYLLFKCSPVATAVHHDQGGLIFYAHGSPLLVDPPAPPIRPGAWAHNTVRIGGRAHRSPGRILRFAEQAMDSFAVGEIEVDALSEWKEFTRTELEAAAKAAETAEAPEAAGAPKAAKVKFVPPPGHAPDGAQTTDMVATTRKLDVPVTITRRLLFNKTYQYLVVYDHIAGYESSDVFFNVFADDARVEGRTVTFAGPLGVDLTLHAFGPEKMTVSLNKDTPQRWTLRLSQPGHPKPEEKVEDKSKRPVTEYFTVLCPSRRRLPGEGDVVERAAPKVERIEGLRAVRISHGQTVRYIFLANKKIEYVQDDLVFKGSRGIVTTRPTHVDVALFDAGEVRYKGRGVATDYGMVRFTIAPGGFVRGETSGPDHKRLTFYGLGRSPGGLAYRIDDKEFLGVSRGSLLGMGDKEKVTYGVTDGQHKVEITPK